MSGWMWVALLIAVWCVAACFLSLLVGRVVRTRDLPEARHLRELQAASLTPIRPVRLQAGGRLVEDRPVTYA